MYRMQVMGKNVTGMHWQRHKTGARHLEAAQPARQRLEVAVALGGDPALTYAATAPIPPIPGINEYSLTGYLRGRGVELVKGITVDLEVPAHAEIVLEGYVDPDEDWVVEGPFGDHTGFYTLQDLYPAFHVTAITMRRDAVYPATIVGRPPMEDAYLIEASERLFLVPAQLILPEIVDYHMPPAGIAHNLVNVVIEKGYPGPGVQGRQRPAGPGPDDVRQGDPGDRRRRPAKDHPGFWRTVLANARARPRPPDRQGADRRARPRQPRLELRQQADRRRHREAPRGARRRRREGYPRPERPAWEPGPERDRATPAGPRRGARPAPARRRLLVPDHPQERADQGRHIGEWAARQAAARACG
jgi:hypothetical protein